LRNSVTGARLAVQLHQRACASDGESLAVALRELEMAEEQVAAFLHLGEIRPSRHAPVDLASLAREVQRLMTPLCRHRGISLTTNLPDGQVLVPGNRGQLRQLLLNLLVNAVEASAGGAEVRLTLRADAASVRLCVEDEGPGVPPEVEHRIFDPFVTTKPEGVGLGLSVAQQIVQAHRGRLSYERIDRITVFSVTLSRIELAQEGHPESRCVEMMAHV
jgi:signal transduction histidine kinase